jgi:quinol monooxygenase YgiN
MIVAYVALQTKANASAEFERLITDIQAEVRQMEGCVKQEWYHHPESPQRYVAYGEFQTHAHFEAYMQSPSVTRIREELMPLLAGPPEFKHYDAVLLDGS